MNKERLYRGKRVDNGEWVEGSAMIWNGHAQIIKHHHMINSIWQTESFRVIPETVGQFTGLTDKNGKEMFEGDVITNYDFKYPLIIGFNDESASFCGSKTNNFETKNCFWFYNDIVLTDGWEVIRNIYDNPDMI